MVKVIKFKQLDNKIELLSKDVIDSLDASSIKAYIDLSGLGVGEHSVEVKVVGEDSKVTYTSRVKEIKVKISQK